MKYFLIYLFLEVLVSVNISSSLGGLLTFVEIMFSAMVGIVLLVNYRSIVVENLSAVSYRKIDLLQFQKLNIFTIIGAFLLIVPGFLTDIIGVLMQFGVFTSMLVNRYAVQSKNYKSYHHEENYKQKDADVIDVEIISEHTSLK
jgi:2-isopropylmalate synthase/UPF0716 protein FxsA